MNIPKNNIEPKSLSFSGHSTSLDKTGYTKHNFYYAYDPDMYDCSVELYNIAKDEYGNYSILEQDKPAIEIPLNGGVMSQDMNDISEITSKEGFAYRFKLTGKDKENLGQVSYGYDNGILLGALDTKNTDNKYNVVLNNRAVINKHGAMQLIMPDGYYPGIENKNGTPELNMALRSKALSSVRTHANKLGGNFYGIIARLPEIKKEGISRIVGTPFTKDTVSSHLYWTENAYQVAPTLGTEEDFKNLQVELFKNGINWVADAALVNEGFGGIHISDVLRKGNESLCKNMFRTGDKVSLGILPEKSEYTRMKLVNAPFVVSTDNKKTENNPDYNPLKPTYIQFYDDRLASEKQKTSDEIFTTYDNKNTKNIFDITKHDDAVYAYPIEVNPQELKRNVENVLQTENKLDLSNINTIKRVSDFTNFNVETKSSNAELEVWDGNVDIAKLAFYRSVGDNERFSQLPVEQQEEAVRNFDKGNLAVKDYALTSGKYWTRLTANTQLEYSSTELGNKNAKTADDYMAAIQELVNEGKYPESVLENVDKEVIENVLNNDYHSRKLDDADMRNKINPETRGNEYTLDEYVLKSTMDIPLETIPAATNLLGILTSPYIAKKANTDDELLVSRYDLSKAGNPNLPEEYKNVYNQMEKFYQNSIVPITEDIISQIPDLQDSEGNVSEYGKFVISEVAQEVTKYILVKALDKNANIKFTSDGQIDFSKVKQDELTMQSIGIPYAGKTPEEEAQMLINVLKKGVNEIPEEEIDLLKNKMADRFANRTLDDFKVAEMIMDRTESGLGWRIDAAKDIASIDAVRSDSDDMSRTWKNVIDFWSRYNKGVLEENPHIYTTAEITDLYDLFKNSTSKDFTSDADAERKFLEKTGITCVANYNFFFSLLPQLFSESYEDGIDNPGNWMSHESKNCKLRDKLTLGWGENPGYLFQSPDGGKDVYNFFGNHDKERILHTLALDMNLFRGNLTSDNDKKIAADVLNKKAEDISTQDSAKAVAMGLRIKQAFEANPDLSQEEKNALSKAISDVASGNYKGCSFDSEAFGTRSFKVAIQSVIEQAEYNGAAIQNKEKLQANTLKNILLPAQDKYLSMAKLIVALPGSPTDFAGDRVSATGYETKAKNYHQQNRNIIDWEWLENPDYKYAKEFYDKTNEIENLRTDKKLSALNDGDTISINMGCDYLHGLLRYNGDSMVLSLHDSSGSAASNTEMMDRTDKRYGKEVLGKDKKPKLNAKGQTIMDGKIDRIPLNISASDAKQGVKHGLKVGDKFKKYGDNSSAEYVVNKDTDNNYYIEKKVRNDKGVWKTAPITIEPEDYNTLLLYKE